MGPKKCIKKRVEVCLIRVLLIPLYSLLSSTVHTQENWSESFACLIRFKIGFFVGCCCWLDPKVLVAMLLLIGSECVVVVCVLIIEIRRDEEKRRNGGDNRREEKWERRIDGWEKREREVEEFFCFFKFF